MRLLSLIFGSEQVFCPKERSETYRDAGQRVASSLLSVDDTDRRAALETCRSERLDRLHGGSARGDDALDQTNALARLERAFEPVRGAVGLRFLANDQERKARRERGGGRERDGAELRPREPVRLGLVQGDSRGEPLAERAEQVGPGLEAVLVQVVARAPAGTQDEVALEVRVLLERAPKLGVVQLRTGRAERGSGVLEQPVG